MTQFLISTRNRKKHADAEDTFNIWKLNVEDI